MSAPIGKGAWLAMSLACAGLALVVLVLIGLSWWQDRMLFPLENSPILVELARQVRASPGDEGLKEELRREDRRLRALYFRHHRRRELGGWLLFLFAGGALWCTGRRRALVREERPPMPDLPGVLRPRPRWPELAGLVGLAVAAGGLFVAGAARARPLPALPVAKQEKPPDYRHNWPGFRGLGNGHAPPGDYPRAWDAAKGEGVLWKTPVTIPGHSSPVIWGDRIYLTGGEERRRVVLCFDRTDGRRLWTRLVRTPPESDAAKRKEPLQVYPDTGYAASTPVTDGERVYAIFATGDLAALSREGEVLWVRNLGIPASAYSFSSSLACHRGRVLVQYDQGGDPDLGLSRLLAFAGGSGEKAWEKKRPVGGSWSSPQVLPVAGKPQLVTTANPWVIAYDPWSGEELWRCNALYGDVAPSPVSAGEVVFVTNDMAQVAAIKATGRGDVTGTHILWTALDGCADTASPLTDGEFFFQVRQDGQMTCYAAATGKLLWEEFADYGFKASPVLAGGRVYLTDQVGETVTFVLGPGYEVLSRGSLGEAVSASPAFGDGRIYFRGAKHLFCLGSGK